MQDNVTQGLSGDIRASVKEIWPVHSRPSADEFADVLIGNLKCRSPEALAALTGEGRLASTAQPEVKALVEAVERSAKMIDKAASAAVDQDSPALAEALDNIEFRLRLALAAYHEAQP